MLKGMFHFLKLLKTKISEDNITALSSQLTYFLLLSFFPFVMFLLTILSYTTITQTEVINRIGEIFPQDVRLIIVAILKEIGNNRSSALLSVTVLITLWSASRGVLALVKGLNIAYDLDETRSFFLLRLASIIYTLVFAVLIVLTFTLLIFGNRLIHFITSYFTIAPEIMEKVQMIRFIFPMGILFLFFIVIYNASPNRKVSIIEVIPGSIFASVSWMLISIAFSFYIDNFGNFSYMYGSLAGIIVLLLWLYISSNIIMIGGEINALLVQLKKQK